MTKRILITGITGMAGSHLAEMLIDEPGCQVFGSKRWRSSLANIASFQDRLELIDCNLTDATNTRVLIWVAMKDTSARPMM